jgi:hypothetical protein
MRLLMILAVLCGLRGLAVAGICLGDEETEVGMRWIEKLAKNAKLAESRETDPWMCVRHAVPGSAKLKQRVLAACEKILDRDGAKSGCWDLAAAAGASTLGKHDVFAHVAAYEKENPLDSSGDWLRLSLFGHMADSRGAPLIIEHWKETLPRAEAREKKKKDMSEWSSWRQTAAWALGKTASKADIAFLDEQAKATKDKRVAAACRKAIAEIDKRAAAPAPAPAAAP